MLVVGRNGGGVRSVARKTEEFRQTPGAPVGIGLLLGLLTPAGILDCDNEGFAPGIGEEKLFIMQHS